MPRQHVRKFERTNEELTLLNHHMNPDGQCSMHFASCFLSFFLSIQCTFFLPIGVNRFQFLPFLIWLCKC
ncbi:hypothetical protein L6452_42110 [Arctium lappa]|uniref:Uncharacterized protein n=1 Tax=Arctium lappa TaxID=4217 RepID=A0ACB8XIJ1_ARCLA|nr:hypothetical protein L6452_42110 [Arctium lappa]